jgi:predicted lipid-binding transport protein (Tim44 family)
MAPQPSFFQRNPFMAGVMGGVAGSLIGGLLFNHSRGEAAVRNGGVDDDLDAAAAVSPAGKMLGSMIPFILLAGLILLGVWFYRRNAAQSLVSSMGSTGYAPGPTPMRDDNWGSSATAPVATSSLSTTQSDIAAFKDLLVGIQEAWGKADIVKLKRMTTPEMLSYFSETLSSNASQGIENCVKQVSVLKQETTEAWDEENLQYATVQFVWSAFDYTVNTGRNPGDSDYVVEGDIDRPVEVSETWTFVRSRGGHWLLSAIQQA